jgi:4-aminobutyrate--pyruvate transaminase
MSTLSALQNRDINYHLHPYTNAVKHQQIGPRVIERGEGIYVFDDQGNKYIEGMAGLWSVAVGFNEQRLVDAATRQMAKLPFYHTFSHKTHTPSVELAACALHSSQTLGPRQTIPSSRWCGTTTMPWDAVRKKRSSHATGATMA